MSTRRLDWRSRFTAASVTFPVWAPARPDRLFFIRDAGGSGQVWAHEVRSGRSIPVTDQPLGVESFVVLADGTGVAWWRDDVGDEHGAWMVTALPATTKFEPSVRAPSVLAPSVRAPSVLEPSVLEPSVLEPSAPEPPAPQTTALAAPGGSRPGAAASRGGSTTPLVAGLPAGWAQGLSLAGSKVAVALADRTGYRVWAGELGGAVHLVHESVRPAGLGRPWEPSWPGGLSSDGELLCLWHTESGDVLHVGLRVLEVRDGRTRQDLADPGLTLAPACWSPVPGDQRLAFIHERDGVARPALWSAESGRRDYPLDLPGPVDVAGWWPDGSALLVMHELAGRRTLHRLDLGDGSATLVHDPQGWVSGAGVRPDFEVWLRDESAQRPPQVRSVDGTVVLAPPGPAPAPGQPHHSVVFSGPGGPTQMWVAEPPGPGPHPTVLMVHGGPEWAYPDDLDPWEQCLLDHGYLVAKVNYRGSTGREVSWRTALHEGNIGWPECADVVAGLDHLVTAGLADPARVAIEGWSWGGYVAVLAAGLYPDRFAAAIGGVPVCDLVRTHQDCSPPQQDYDLAIMGGGPDDLPARYAERSPLTYADRVRAPMLLIAGEHDSACPIRQVRHYADVRRSFGGLVELFVYDAGHHAGSLDQRVRHAELELEFLARHLHGEPPR